MPEATIITSEFDDSAPEIRTERNIGWLGIPMLVAGLVLPIVVLLVVRPEYLAGAFLAYVNCILIGSAIVYLGSRQTVEAMIPLLVLPLMLVSWPLGSLYWAITDNPDALILLVNAASIHMLEGNERLQLVLLIFMAGYLPVVLYCGRRKGPVPPPYVGDRRRWANATMALAAASYVPVVVLRVFKFDALAYLTYGLYGYGQGILFLEGALFQFLTKKAKILLLTGVAAVLLFSTITGDRGLIAYALVATIAGAFFLGHISSSVKLLLTVGLAVGLPLFVLIGDTSRAVLGTKELVDLSYQYKLIKEYKDIQAGVTPLDSFFGRAHWTGGHNILLKTPEQLPYLSFDLTAYTKEMLASLLPGRWFYNPYYGGNYILRDYGHVIYEGSSVEISLIGHFWLMGGYVPVFLGAIAFGLLHCAVMIRLRRAYRRSELRAFTYLAVMASFLVSSTQLDLISNFRSFVWFGAAGWLTYQFLRLVTQADQPEGGELQLDHIRDDQVFDTSDQLASYS